MSDGASALMGIVQIGGLLGGGFLLLLFTLWASGRSPRIKLTGEMVGALFYASLASSQLWNEHEAHRATLWKVALALALLSAGFTAYRIFKTFGQNAEGGDPPGAARP